MNNSIYLRIFIVVFLMLFSLSATAARLEVSSDSHYILRWGANFILYLHIAGGTIGLITGLIASLVKKGAFLHRKSGKVFLFSMLACYGIGAIAAPFLEEGQRPNFIAAILALYLLISGIQATQKGTYRFSAFNKFGLAVSLFITAMGLLFMIMGFQSETGTVDGSPPNAFVVFVLAGVFASMGEIRLYLIKQLSPQGRIFRHLWRMSFSFFIAAGSLFIGQAKFFPEWFNTSPAPGLLSAFPLTIIAYWGAKYLIQNLKKQRAQDKNKAEQAG